MLRTIFWATWLLFYLVGHIPICQKAARLGKQGKWGEQQAIVRRIVKSWSTKLLRHIGVTLTVEGCENLPDPAQPVMFVSNHQSYMDIPVLLSGLDFPRPLLAKKQLGGIPMFSKWMKLLGCLFVERDDVRSSMDALREGEALLKNGQSLIVCPEGTRSKSDQMGEFKSGAVRMAYKAGVPVVPIAIDGTWRILEGSGYRLKKCNVRMIILPQVSTSDLSRTQQRELASTLEATIRAAKDNRGSQYTK